MDEEFYFKCEICGKNFPADPNTMLECATDFKVIDVDTGKTVEVDDDIRKEVFDEMSKDPSIAPFVKGTICMCIACQDDWIKMAKEEQETEKRSVKKPKRAKRSRKSPIDK